jgi:hypothetical protein
MSKPDLESEVRDLCARRDIYDVSATTCAARTA